MVFSTLSLIGNMAITKTLQTALVALVLTGASMCWAPDFEMHLLVGDECQKICRTLPVDPIIEKPIEWVLMMGSHRWLDYNVGEGYIGQSHYESTFIGTVMMYMATPESKKGDFIENFICTCLIPDILFKKAFHGSEDHLIDLTGDQTSLGDKISILIYQCSF